LGVAIFIDIFGVSHRYIYADKFTEISEEVTTPRPVDSQILADKDPFYRVQDFTIDSYNDAQPSYFHKMIGGYHPAKLEIYQDLIERQMTPGSAHNNGAVYNMLNTKYFIVPSQDGSQQVVPNTEACGNAWFVPNIKTVATADEEMAALNAPNIFDTTKVAGNFNPKQTAILRNSNNKLVTKSSYVVDSSSSIKLQKYGLNELEFESNNANEGFGVFSDIYYPEWKAFIDGKEVEISRTNYVLRGLMIPAGKHNIKFSLNSPILSTWKPISMITSILAIILAVFAFYMSQKKKETELEPSL
jgi:hypothetical protein